MGSGLVLCNEVKLCSGLENPDMNSTELLLDTLNLAVRFNTPPPTNMRQFDEMVLQRYNVLQQAIKNLACLECIQY